MKQYQLIIPCVLFIVINLGCRKFVELDPPKTLVVTASIFEDDVTASSALTTIYAEMVNKDIVPFAISGCTALQGDELYSPFGGYADLYQNSLRAQNAYTNRIWSAAYNYIYKSNAVYEGCENSKSLSGEVKKQLMAEARFIRGFWYLYLVNFYGEVPLVLTTDYRVNAVMARTAVDKVYEQIFNDLRYAQDNLNGDYVGGNSTTSSAERVRPNKITATALLARAYLYKSDFTNAALQASTVISDPRYIIETDLSKTFLKESREAIWQLMIPLPSLAGIDTYEGNYYIITSVPSTGGSQSFTISDWLYRAFETNDKRKDKWIGKASGGDFYFPYKYKVLQNKTSSLIEHSIVIRLAELYLIRAEADAQLGKMTEAIHDTDVIRGRAGLPLIQDTRPTISKSDLLAAIYKERRLELFTEWGHRWIDLKRTGEINQVMIDIAPEKNTVWESYKQLWPIPGSDITNNRNLKQNPGYN